MHFVQKTTNLYFAAQKHFSEKDESLGKKE